MVSAKFKKEVISRDEDQYEIPESIEATFINVDKSPVEIEGYKIEEGEPFKIGSSGCVLTKTTVSIRFLQKRGRKILLFYNAPTNC